MSTLVLEEGIPGDRDVITGDRIGAIEDGLADGQSWYIVLDDVLIGLCREIEQDLALSTWGAPLLQLASTLHVVPNPP